MKGLDIEKIARGFWYAATDRLRELREYIKQRQEKEPVKFAPIYIDILHKIDEILKNEKNM